MCSNWDFASKNGENDGTNPGFHQPNEQWAYQTKKRFTVSSKHADSTGKNMWFVHSFSNKHEEYRNANVKSTKKTDGIWWYITSGIPTWQWTRTHLTKTIYRWGYFPLSSLLTKKHLRMAWPAWTARVFSSSTPPREMQNVEHSYSSDFLGTNTHFLCTVVQ